MAELNVVWHDPHAIEKRDSICFNSSPILLTDSRVVTMGLPNCIPCFTEKLMVLQVRVMMGTQSGFCYFNIVDAIGDFKLIACK